MFKNTNHNLIRFSNIVRYTAILVLIFILVPVSVNSQFYNGSNQTFGKNRVQYNEFLWTYYKFQDIDTYFYLNGKELAQYTARYAKDQIPKIESKLGSLLDKKIQFIVYNNLTDLKQSNIGLMTNENYNVGGITHIIGSKVFIYFDGSHEIIPTLNHSGREKNVDVLTCCPTEPPNII